MKNIKGYYQHFKGGLYKVIGKGVDSNNVDNVVVVYKSKYSNHQFKKNTIWIRPYDEFFSMKNSQLRFKKISFISYLFKKFFK